MNEEQTEQIEETVQETETEQSNEPATIGDIAKQYNVEEQATSFQQEAKPQPVETPSSPDPYLDPDAYAQHQLNQTVSAITSVKQKMEAMERQMESERLNSDIKQAVAKIDVEGVDETFKELFLEKQYREDSNFKKIWDARYANPKALDAALKVYASQVAKTFNVKTDPQLVENQQAAKKSQRTMATAPTEGTLEDKLMNLDDASFSREWNRMRGR